jgi:hypothetical protein
MNYSGKTTAAKKAMQHLNDMGLPHVYQHLDRPPECFDFYWGYADLCRLNIVQDRLHWSEFAYAAVEGTPPRMSDVEKTFFESMLETVPCVTVVMAFDPSAHVLLDARHETASHRRYDADQVRMINSAWLLLQERYHNLRNVFHVRLTEEKPYIEDDVLWAIVHSYVTQRQALDAISERR